MKIGITGNSGFIGRHLTARLERDCTIVPFDKTFFESQDKMKKFADECDIIIHLAAVSRHDDGEYLYNENMRLTKALVDVLTQKNTVFLGSTTHIEKTLPYHASKRDAAKMLAGSNAAHSCALLMANTFGAGSRPFYNSVVSTFCHLAAVGKKPEVIEPSAMLNLIYIRDLCDEIAKIVLLTPSNPPLQHEIPHRYDVSLISVWDFLESGRSPVTPFERDLAETAEFYRI